METALGVLVIIGAGIVVFSIVAVLNVLACRSLTQAGHRLYPRMRRQPPIGLDQERAAIWQASVLNGFPRSPPPVAWFALTPDHIVERRRGDALVIERAHVEVVHLMLWEGALLVVFRGSSDRYRSLALGPVPVDRFMNDLIELGWPVAPQEIAIPLREVPEGFNWWPSPSTTTSADAT